jgi:hypothetical protein
MNSINEVKALHTKKYKILMKKLKKTGNCKNMPLSQNGRTLLKCPYYPKKSTDAMQFLFSKNPNSILYRNRKKSENSYGATEDCE